MESFFKSLKVERIHRRRYATRSLARLDIVDGIEGFYNRRHLHSSVGYKTPVAVESISVRLKLVYVKSRQRRPSVRAGEESQGMSAISSRTALISRVPV